MERYFVFYSDRSDGVTDLAEFEYEDQALRFCEGLARKSGVNPESCFWRVIEGQEIKLEAVEVVTAFRRKPS